MKNKLRVDRYPFDSPIWQIRADAPMGKVGIELRDAQARRAGFTLIDLHARQKLYPPVSMPEPWWCGLAAVYQAFLVVHGYADPKMPVHRGIWLLTNTGKVWMELSSAQWIAAANTGLYFCDVNEHGEPITDVYVLGPHEEAEPEPPPIDWEDQVSRFERSQKLRMTEPTVIEPDTPEYAALESRLGLTAQPLTGPLEVVQTEQLTGVVGHTGAGPYAQQLWVIGAEGMVGSFVLGEGLSGLATEGLMGLDGWLLAVAQRSTLLVIG